MRERNREREIERERDELACEIAGCLAWKLRLSGLLSRNASRHIQVGKATATRQTRANIYERKTAMSRGNAIPKFG